MVSIHIVLTSLLVLVLCQSFHSDNFRRRKKNRNRKSFSQSDKVECAGGSWNDTYNCCTSEKPCKLYQGHCDTDGECEGNLVCGIRNCGDSFAWKANCCMKPECGVKLKGRIVGGEEATPFSIPWQVALVEIGNRKEITCGGSLISDRHVLTAAHCTRGLRGCGGDIIVGEHDLSNPDDGILHTYSRFVDHPLWEYSPTNYDFSILHLDKPVEFGERAAPVCLLPTGLKRDYFDGKILTVSGWGRPCVSIRPCDTVQKLRYVKVPGFSQQRCKDLLSPAQVTDAMLCAGNTSDIIDACGGDSGGPLTYESEGRTFIVGVVSWGRGCGEKLPGVYARVTEVLPWINEQLKQTVNSTLNCPRDYPYSFDRGLKCCETNKDGHGHPLRRTSTSCALNAYKDCPGEGTCPRCKNEGTCPVCKNYLGIDILGKEYLRKILNCGIKKELGLIEFQASMLNLVQGLMKTIEAYKLIQAFDKHKPCKTCHETAKDQRVTELISNVRGGRKLLRKMKSNQF